MGDRGALRLSELGCSVDGHAIVAPVSLDIALGRRTVVLGPNGAGKSTLLQLIHGMRAATSGSVVMTERTGESRSPGAADVGLVLQRPVMLARTVVRNVEHALAVRGLPRGSRASVATRALEAVGLRSLAQRHARDLSGGEQQRLAIARVIAGSPACLLLDEPSASLDPGAAAGIERLLLSLSEAGLGIVMSTHDLGQARRIAQEVIFMHRGQVVESGDARAFFGEPRTEPARRFLAGDWIE